MAIALAAAGIWALKALVAGVAVTGSAALTKEIVDLLDWTDKWDGPFDYTGNKKYDDEWENENGTGTETVTPGTEAVTPGTEAVTPGTEAVTPGTEAVTPGTEAVTPGTEAVTPGTETIPQNPNEQYDDKTTATLPSTPEIEDKTQENIETKINWLDWAEEQQAKEWAEQERRTKAQWEREDTAWQRWVADMRKAGVNPNLINAQPTAGSSAMQPTQINIEAAMKEIQIDADKLMQMIEKDFQGDQNTKDRIQKYISSLISMGTMVGILYGKKGK